MAAPRAYPTLTEEQQRHFWEKVDRRSVHECWPWTRATKGRGYGALTVNKQPLSAHRVAWELTYGPLPEGREEIFQVVCNDPCCCNPYHLAVGSHSDAMQAASRHGTKLGRGTHTPKQRPAQVQYAKPYPKLTEKQEAAFWDKVDKHSSPHGCWLWTAACCAGYGTQKVAGRNLRASRISYGLHYGDPPVDVDVCHNCPGGDNPLCVNPAHLYLGTRKRNMKDCVSKGRKNAARGRKAGKTKLTVSQVYEIRRRGDAGGSRKLMGAEFGVNPVSISDIVSRKNWKYLPEIEEIEARINGGESIKDIAEDLDVLESELVKVLAA